MEKRKENMILLQQQHEPGTNADAIAKKEKKFQGRSITHGGQSRTNLHCFNHWEKK
jgi:hypothetical protein